MAKLHELLAVEGNLKAQADKTRNELMATFKAKSHHFTERRVTVTPVDDTKEPVVEEQGDMQTTVPKEIGWVSAFIIKALDAAYQVDEGNTEARADIVLEDGTVIAQRIPATYLLQLERRMKELHDFVSSIPTLDPSKGFRFDDQRGVFAAREKVTPRTKKILAWQMFTPATDKHPAQGKEYTEDVVVAHAHTQEWSGLITPVQKGEIIEKVENLARAVKQARSRANDVNVDVHAKKIGQTLLNYVFEGYI